MKSIFITSLLCLFYTIGYSQNHKYFKLLDQQRTDTICTNDSMYKIHYAITNTEDNTYIKTCTEKTFLYKIPPHLLELGSECRDSISKRKYWSNVNSIIYNHKTVTAGVLSSFLLWKRTYSKEQTVDTIFYEAILISILSQILLLLCFFGLYLVLEDFGKMRKAILSIPNEIRKSSIKQVFNKENMVPISAYLVISSLISTTASEKLFDIVYGEVFIGYLIYNTIILSILLLIMKYMKFQ